MASSSSLHRGLARFAELGAAERRAALQALALLPAVTALLQLQGMGRARALATVLVRALPPLDRALAAKRVAELVAGVANHLGAQRVPRVTCLARSLVVCALLERRGERPQLRLGVLHETRPSAGPLDAHAWVELHDEVLDDGTGAHARYATLEPAK